MASQKLNYIEDHRGGTPKPFSSNEIRSLLVKNRASGVYENLQQYYENNKELVESQYGAKNPLDAFRKDLEQRLQLLKDLLYYKGIEDGLANKIEARLDEQKAETRDHIQGLIGHVTKLDPDALDELRNSDITHFHSRHFRVDEDFLRDYVDLVRSEVEEQLHLLAWLKPNESMAQQREGIDEIYSKSTFLVDFVLKHLDQKHGNREYVKAFLLRSIRSEQGPAFIDELYHEVYEALATDDVRDCQRQISQLATRLETAAVLEKKNHVQDILKKHVAELDITDDELDVLLSGRRRTNKNGEEFVSFLTDGQGMTYHERLAHHIEELEDTQFEMLLYQLKSPDASAAEMKQTQVDFLRTLEQKTVAEVAGLKKDLLRFRDEYYNVDFLVDQHDWLDLHTKQQLKAAIKNTAGLRAVSAQYEGEQNSGYRQLMNPLLVPVRQLQNKSQAEAIIEHAKAEVRAYLKQQGLDPEVMKRVEEYEGFDLFSFFTQWKKDQEIEKAIEQGLESGITVEEFLQDLDSPLDAETSLGEIEREFEDLLDVQKTNNPYKKAQEKIKILAYSGTLDAEKSQQIESVIQASSLSEQEQKKLSEELSSCLEILEQGDSKESFTSFVEASKTITLLAAAGRISELSATHLSAAVAKSNLSDDQQRELNHKLDQEVLNARIQSEASREASEEDGPDTSPIISKEEVLRDARKYMADMDEICERKFANTGDVVRFDELNESLKRLLKKQLYRTAESLADEKGSPMFNQGEQVLHIKYRQKRLPILDQQFLEKLLHHRYQDGRYGEVQELRASNFFQNETNFENPTTIRKGLEALYAGYNNLNKGQMGLRKLTQVMLLDHPITCIRFNAADQEPFLYNGKYQIHRVPGHSEPATYLERSKEFLRAARQHVMSGSFESIDELMRNQNIGQRLFLDASFFPVKKLKDPEVCHNMLYRKEERFTEEGVEIEWVIDDERINGDRDRKFFEKSSQKMRDTFRYDSDLSDLIGLRADALVDDESYQLAFNNDRKMLLEALQHRQNLGESGDETEAAMQALLEHVGSGGEVKSLGIPGNAKIPEETIKQIAKDYPRIAGRMMQLNSMWKGAIVGGVDSGVRSLLNYGVLLPYQSATTIGGMWWKSVTFYNPLQIWSAIDQMIEHIRNLSDFYVRSGSYKLLMNVFDGTLIGNEFTKLYQAEEDKRVGEFKDAFDDFGNQQIIDKIYACSDEFELKAALIEGFENRGILTLEHLLDRRFFRSLNRYSKNVTLPLNFTEEQMNQDEDIQFTILDKLRESMDDIWGDGTWQSWRSAGASKYESKRQEAGKNFEGNSPREKARWFGFYWELLKTDSGVDKLAGYHPGELVGNVEQDMLQGDLDVGQTFSIMQAFICKGLIKLDHVRRLQSAHSNDLPIHALLEPKEAEVAGLTQFVEDTLKSGAPYDPDKNPLIEFYQGKRAIKLKAHRYEGKWRFPKTQKAADGLGDAHQEIVVTVHQLQKNREAQPEWHRKMDNCCIGIFTPCYAWTQIENALRPDTQGNIEGRPHDIVAAYRGIHHEFAAYMDSMGNSELMTDATTFKRQVWHAYEALCKTQAYAGFMARHISRDNDYTFNTLDGSPNLDVKHSEKRAQGKTNFEKLLLGNEGPHQRMSESSQHLDGLDVTDRLRVKFKKMAGFQFVKSLGVNPDTGKKDPTSFEAYDIKKYDPVQAWKEVMPEFIRNVELLADRHGFGQEIRESLGRSGMGDLRPGNNAERVRKLNSWLHNEAKMS